eukprot:gene35466-45959_t
MILDTNCGKKLTPGNIIMQSTLAVDDSVSIQVHRGGLRLSSLDYYTPGESLTVTISTSSEYVLEATNAKFVGGSCSQNRIVSSSAKLVMPSSPLKVSVWAALADSEDTARLTPTIILQPSATIPSPFRKSIIEMLSMNSEPHDSLIMDINRNATTVATATATDALVLSQSRKSSDGSSAMHVNDNANVIVNNVGPSVVITSDAVTT